MYTVPASSLLPAVMIWNNIEDQGTGDRFPIENVNRESLILLITPGSVIVRITGS